jgi:hypothetical protein
METKVCIKCKEEKDISEFGKCNKVKSGLASKCRECKRNESAKYRAEDKNKIWYIKNREKLRLQAKEKYRKNHPKKEYIKKTKEEYKQYRAQYYKDNKDHLRKLHQEYKKNHEEEIRQWRKTHRELINSTSKKWRDKNIDRLREHNRKYISKNREKIRKQATINRKKAALKKDLDYFNNFKRIPERSTKICVACKVEKPLNSFYKNRKLHLTWCILCENKKRRERRKEIVHKEIARNYSRDYSRAYRMNNPYFVETQREKALEYRQRNRSKIIEYNRNYRKINRERLNKRHVEMSQRVRLFLGDTYIVHDLCQKGTIQAKDVRKYPELIKTKRTLLQINREINKINQTKN